MIGALDLEPIEEKLGKLHFYEFPGIYIYFIKTKTI